MPLHPLVFLLRTTEKPAGTALVRRLPAYGLDEHENEIVREGGDQNQDSRAVLITPDPPNKNTSSII